MLKDELELDVTLIKGSNGIFEVAVDGVVVAKKQLGGFPTEQQVLDAVVKALGPEA